MKFLLEYAICDIMYMHRPCLPYIWIKANSGKAIWLVD